MGHEVVAAAQTVGMGAPPPTSLAPGFRFHPTDEELVRYYLRRKVCRKPFRFKAVTEIDVYKSEPWELAVHSSLKNRDQEWYFFSPVDRKYGNGSRLNRATGQGYWKATGKDRFVRHKNQNIGMKKTLVFHSGRAPDGKRTNWVMHEYRLCDLELESAGVSQDAFVLCRIFEKSGLGPPSGDRYAPFVEEEWDEDAGLLVPGGDAEDDVVNGEEVRVECNDLDQDPHTLSIAPPLNENPVVPQSLSLICKRERSEDREPTLSLSQSKRSKHDDPNTSNAANGSEDSTTTSRNNNKMIMTKNSSSPTPLEFALLQPNKENNPANPVSFDSSNLEKYVPPGYLKLINNLENEIMNVSMERETFKIEVMRAQAMMNILQSNLENLSKENDALRGRA